MNNSSKSIPVVCRNTALLVSLVLPQKLCDARRDGEIAIRRRVVRRSFFIRFQEDFVNALLNFFDLEF